MKKRIFISYSWDNELHKNWVLSFADRLEEIEELHVILDQYDLDCTSDKNQFMEQGVFDSDWVLIISTDSYTKKANERKGGVGIETKLTASKHWEETSAVGNSNILVLLRDCKSTPNYLKEKLHIDFSSHVDFENSFKSVIAHINEDSKKKRPPKKITLSRNIILSDFTRSEDIIKINHKKRRMIFDKEDCVDFSNRKKIKFELWETTSPRKDFYLILFKNTTFKETVERFCELYSKACLRIKELTILRPTFGDNQYIQQLFKENNINISMTEVTYSDFIWEYCIDDEAKGKGNIYENPFFIDQSLIKYDEEKIVELGPASEFIKNEFCHEQKSAALIILAPGGMGKTTLCQNLANHFQTIPKSSAVFIQSETIKNSNLKDLTENASIESIYDLYEIYAKVSSADNSEFFTYDRTTFELSLLSGNLVVIVDGIDELLSVFPENFNVEAFVGSIVEINNQLGNSKILLTSREDIFSNETLSGTDEIQKFTLLGFDELTCEKYLRKRFKKYTNPTAYSESVMSHVRKLLTSESNEHVLPFFVDLISGLVEEVSGEKINFDLSLISKKYDSNSEIIDCLVYSVFRREYKRQDLEIQIEDVVGLFQEMSSVYGDTFKVSAVEEYVSIFFNEFSGSLTRKLLRNPLLLVNDGVCKFKYEFLADYFSALYLIDLINVGASDDQFISALARHAYGDKSVFKEVKKYYRSNPDKFLASGQKVIAKISSNIDENKAFKGNELCYRALSALVHLAVELPMAQGTKESLTTVIKHVFNSKDKIEHLSIYGDIPPLDFSNTEVWYSKFVKYKKFLSSKFNNSQFYYSSFDGVKDSAIPSSLRPEMFSSCRLGDLDAVIEESIHKQNSSAELIEKEVNRFLASFFNRGIFKDKKKRYIKFSDKTKAVGQKFFDNMLKEEYVIVKVKKSDETYYEINPIHHPSVHNFINNNTIDFKIRNILKLAS